MTRASKRDALLSKADEPVDDSVKPRPHATVKTWPPSMRSTQPSLPLPPSGGRPSKVMRKIDANEWDPDERLRSALGWYRFEAWCAANGFRPLANTSETIATIALYMTYLAASGRSLALIARALLRLRDPRE
jgi:hypothetical protein